MTSEANHTLASSATVSDIKRNGILRVLPYAARPYALLSRWDRPVGTWLLLWPALWGLLIGFKGHPPVLLVIAFILGAFFMRGAGCTINDLLDRHYDGAVARTAERPLPAGLISIQAAWTWLAVQLLVAGVLLFGLCPPAVWAWGLAAVPLVLVYPLIKRVSWWPQAWLGLTFNWGIWMGVAAAEGVGVGLPALLLYGAAVCWTIGYDTIYAAQDVQDDALIGVKSTARLFAGRIKQAVTAFYVLTTALWALAFYNLPLSIFSLIGLLPAVAMLIYQLILWKNNAYSARQAFLLNIWVGAAVALGLGLGYLF